MTLAWLPNTSQGRMFGDYISTSVLAGGNAVTVIPIAHAPSGSTFDVGMYAPTGGLPVGSGTGGGTLSPSPTPATRPAPWVPPPVCRSHATDSASGQTLTYSRHRPARRPVDQRRDRPDLRHTDHGRDRHGDRDRHRHHRRRREHLVHAGRSTQPAAVAPPGPETRQPWLRVR